MIRVLDGGSRNPWMQVYPTILSRPNDLLLNWRLLALAVHFTMIVTVTQERPTLLIESSLPVGYSQEDYNAVRSSSDLALAASYISLFVCTYGVFSARTLHLELNNLMHSVCHSCAGILLLTVWYYTSHVARIWHVWYFFGAFPSLIEVLLLVLSRRQGLWKWN